MGRRLHHSHHGIHLHKRIPNAIALPKPPSFEDFVEKPMDTLHSLFKRDSTDSTNDCSNSNSSSPQCQKPTDAGNVTLPVALGILIPLFLAMVIFIYLHRKHVKRLRVEDANDPHKSLDFGWDPKTSASTRGRKKSKKGGPEMSITDLGTEKNGRPRGMSMDLDVGSPYLLPPGLGGSRESLHSMSRTIHSQDDRYRPATVYTSADTKSMHSYKIARRGADDSSSDNGSGSFRRGPRDDMKQDLLGDAQRMSRSMPPTNRSPVPEIRMPDAVKEMPRKAVPSSPQSAGLSPSFPLLDTRDSYMEQNGADLRKSNNYLGAFIHSREPSSDLLGQRSEYATPNEFPSTPSSNLQQTSTRKSPPPSINIPEQINRKSPPPSNNPLGSLPPRGQSLRASETAQYEHFFDDSSEYGDGLKVTPPSPHDSQQGLYDSNRRSSQAYMASIDEYAHGVDDTNGLGYDVRRLSMGMRPLPPDDPTDNPEQRANRIRSFYKEYFDDSKPGAMQAAGGYYEDYDQGYQGDGAMFDPVSNQVVTNQPHYPEQRGRPFAEPMGRRAMTPPARAPPRFGRQHAATMSGSSRLMPPRARAFSSSSGRGIPGRGPPKKQLPPPKALNVLPTPHLLKDDSFALFNSMDFAPPTSAKDRQAGRPESPRGGLRPYSPMVAPHMPLQSSFDDLAAMPSPSGTFTGLDFAPPPRFKDREGTASDAGSIRSNRSGMSASAAHSIRTGAYRVSRIPKEVVGTKLDWNESLRPQWDLNR
ncbi:hypothetical protein P7C71_g5825, partial [Lecanoromycetidae sp. Uapishka_2]